MNKYIISNIKKVINRMPREGLELLLVYSGVKPGDKIEWMHTEKERLWFENRVKSLSKYNESLDYVIDGLGEVVYFNTLFDDYIKQMTSKKELSKYGLKIKQYKNIKS